MERLGVVCSNGLLEEDVISDKYRCSIIDTEIQALNRMFNLVVTPTFLERLDACEEQRCLIEPGFL